MSRRRILSSAGLVAFVLCAARSASAATHPKLLFDGADVPTLQARLAGPMKKIRDAFATGTAFPFEPTPGLPKTFDPSFPDYASDPRALADTVASYAFAALMFDGGGSGVDPTTAAHAKQLGHDYLIGACKYGNWNVPTSDSTDPDLNLAHYLLSVSLAYDWLYPSLTDAERTLCRQKIETEGQKMYDAAKLPSSIWWADEYLQNHCWINHSALGLAALVLKDDSTLDLSAWLTTATAALEKVRTVIDPIAGGAWHEGIGYSNYGMDALTPFSWANVKLAGGLDFADNGFVRDYPRMRLFAAPPAPKHSKEYPVWGDFSGFDGDDNTLAFVRLGARRQKDGVAQWFADRFTDGGESGRTYLTSYPPSQRGLFLSVIFADDTVKPTPPPVGGAWTLDYFAKDLSLFLARSTFGDDGTLLAFKTGVFGGHANWDRMKVKGAPGGGLNPGHDHDDDMNVWLFSDGEWLTTLVPGYWIGRVNGSPEANRTKYANALARRRHRSAGRRATLRFLRGVAVVLRSHEHDADAGLHGARGVRARQRERPVRRDARADQVRSLHPLHRSRRAAGARRGGRQGRASLRRHLACGRRRHPGR